MATLYRKKNDERAGKSGFYEPGGKGGSVDVIRNYKWTNTTLGAAALDEIPYICLTEYRYLRTGMQLLNQAKSNLQIVNAIKDTDPYSSLYDFTNPTGFQYILPFFSDAYYNVNTSFKDSDAFGAIGAMAGGAGAVTNAAKGMDTSGGTAGSVGRAAGYAQAGGALIGGAAKAVEGVAGVFNMSSNAAGGTGKLDLPKIWDTTSPRSITFKVYLFNTIDVKDIAMNWELVHLLRYQNLMNKLTLVTAIPPVFYQVFIPGQHNSIGSWISNLQIDSIGVTRRFKMSDVGLEGSGDVHIPDVFGITITLNDFLMPSQNMIQGVEGSMGNVEVNMSNG